MQRFILVVQTSITPTFPCQRVCQTEVGIKIILLHQFCFHMQAGHTLAPQGTQNANCLLIFSFSLSHTHTHTSMCTPALGQAFGQMQIRPGRGGVSDSVLGNPSGQLGQRLITVSCLPCPHKSHAVDPPVFTTQRLQSVRHWNHNRHSDKLSASFAFPSEFLYPPSPHPLPHAFFP